MTIQKINRHLVVTRDERRKRRKQMAILVEAGFSLQCVARKFGVCVSTIRSACHEFDVVYLGACQPRGMQTTTYNIIAALANTDDTQMEIAERFGVSKQWVGQIVERCQKAGVPLHPGRRFKVERSENGRG